MSTYSIPHPAVRSLTAPRLFVAATAAVVVHIADAEPLQPQPGTHPRDHLLATLVPVAIAVVAAVAFDRVRPGVRAAIAGIFGSLSLVAGLIAVGGARADGISGAEWTGLLLVPAGTMLLGLAVWIPWRERGRWAATRGRLWLHRVAAVVLMPLVLFFVVVPLGAALWTRQKFRTPVGSFAVPHEDVAFRTSDGLELSGWYVPSRNGAAIDIVHGGGGGRDGARRHAALLARAGYGVLLYDARGRGRSERRSRRVRLDVGTRRRCGDRLVEAARLRRIGALGLSTGADVLIEVAARRHDLRAVVADGATARSTADTRRISRGADLLSLPFWFAQYTVASVLEGARPGKPLAELAAHVAPTKFLFIASTWPVERKAAPLYARAAHARLWRVDAGHTQGLRERPRAFARHVLGFFDRALLGRSR
jgi:uncharacterized protein